MSIATLKKENKFDDLIKSLSENGKYHIVTATIYGTFQTGNTQGGIPFVKLNDAVTPNNIVCIIKTMCMLNEIKAKVRGKITAILATNGGEVQYGEPLFQIEKC